MTLILAIYLGKCCSIWPEISAMGKADKMAAYTCPWSTIQELPTRQPALFRRHPIPLHSIPYQNGDSDIYFIHLTLYIFHKLFAILVPFAQSKSSHKRIDSELIAWSSHIIIPRLTHETAKFKYPNYIPPTPPPHPRTSRRVYT